MTRRGLLRLMPFAMTVSVSAAEPAPEKVFPSAPRDRLSVTSYPFRAFFKSSSTGKRMDMLQFPAFVAEQFDVHNINPLLTHFATSDAAYAANFRRALDNASSHIVDLGLGDGYFYGAEGREAGEKAKRGIDAATVLGSPSVRQHLSLHNGETADAGRAAESLKELADYGAQKNVVINLENDDARAEDPFVIVDIIDRVGNPYLRALPDFGNCLVAHDASYNRRAMAAMIPHAWNMCHVKDAVQDKSKRLQKPNLPELFSIAQRGFYRGYFSMEFDTDAGDPVTGTKRLVQETLACLQH